MAAERTETSRTAKKSSKGRAEKSSKPSSASSSSNGRSSNGRSGDGAPRAQSRPRLGATKIAASAAQQLLELTGRAAEGVTGLERSDDGWTVQVEVVEVRRIPDTTDVLALYEVRVDEDGELESYRRLRRYARGSAREDG
jgi:Gas vesicle synthesis protein GvpO